MCTTTPDASARTPSSPAPARVDEAGRDTYASALLEVRKHCRVAASTLVSALRESAGHGADAAASPTAATGEDHDRLQSDGVLSGSGRTWLERGERLGGALRRLRCRR